MSPIEIINNPPSMLGRLVRLLKGTLDAVHLSGHLPFTHASVLSLLLNSSMSRGSLRLAAAHPCAPAGLCSEAAHTLNKDAACLWFALYLAQVSMIHGSWNAAILGKQVYSKLDDCVSPVVFLCRKAFLSCTLMGLAGCYLQVFEGHLAMHHHPSPYWAHGKNCALHVQRWMPLTIPCAVV